MPINTSPHFRGVLHWSHHVLCAHVLFLEPLRMTVHLTKTLMAYCPSWTLLEAYDPATMLSPLVGEDCLPD